VGVAPARWACVSERALLALMESRKLCGGGENHLGNQYKCVAASKAERGKADESVSAAAQFSSPPFADLPKKKIFLLIPSERLTALIKSMDSSLRDALFISPRWYYGGKEKGLGLYVRRRRMI
jgi:hypothetical protein